MLLFLIICSFIACWIWIVVDLKRTPIQSHEIEMNTAREKKSITKTPKDRLEVDPKTIDLSVFTNNILNSKNLEMDSLINS